MTEWVFKRERNGYRNNRGQAVVNGEVFRELEREVGNLEELGAVVSHVKFWHVRRERHTEAGRLANDALGDENLISRGGRLSSEKKGAVCCYGLSQDRIMQGRRILGKQSKT